MLQRTGEVEDGNSVDVHQQTSFVLPVRASPQISSDAKQSAHRESQLRQVLARDTHDEFRVERPYDDAPDAADQGWLPVPIHGRLGGLIPLRSHRLWQNSNIVSIAATLVNERAGRGANSLGSV